MTRRIPRSICLLAIFSLACAISLGQTTGAIDQVEEDWQIVIGSPNPNEVGPQLTTCMSPVADGSTPFVALDLNYRDVQSFQPGGLQVNVYSNGNALSSSTQGDALCNTSNESITWTQRLSLSSASQFTYSIVNGTSTTWGQFGTSNGLSAVSFTATRSSLSSYSPDASVAKSGAGWQSNRVTSMTLLRVRYYSGGQLISTDNNARSVTLSTTSDDD
jgi:hypothetical protein